MITTKSEEKIQKAIELYEVQEARRALDKQEESLKKYFKELIGEENGINAGPVLILLEDCQRTSLDKKSLEAEFGAETISRHEKVTAFKKFVIKKVG